MDRRITSVRIGWQKAYKAGGVPEAVAMKVSGHRTPRVFGRYNAWSLSGRDGTERAAFR